MKRMVVGASILTSLALAGVAPAPAAAQSRVVVPIIIQAPRPAATAPSRTQSIHVTTRTASPQPGVTTSRVTVRDTTGAGRTVGMSAGAKTLGSVSADTPSVLVTVDRRLTRVGRRQGVSQDRAPGTWVRPPSAWKQIRKITIGASTPRAACDVQPAAGALCSGAAAAQRSILRIRPLRAPSRPSSVQ